MEALLGIMAAALCVLNLTVGSAFSADLVKVPTAWLDEHETFLMWYAKEKDGTKRPVWISTSCSSIRAWPSSTLYPQANGSIPASAGSRP